MSTRPADTTPDARRVQQEALARIGPAERVRIAFELSEAVREIQITGILSRNPGWSRAMAVRHFVAREFGVDLPEPR